MVDIYSKIHTFNYSDILDEINEINDKIEEERSKPDTEYDRQKEFDLIYRQFIKGLQLNTGYKIF